MYTSPIGVRYDLTHLCDEKLYLTLSQPEDAEIVIGWREKSLECGEEGLTAGCIHVPGKAVNTPVIWRLMLISK